VFCLEPYRVSCGLEIHKMPVAFGKRRRKVVN
jgi:hypothetical protein